MALPNIYVLEGCTWCGNQVSPPNGLFTRYNSPLSSGGIGIGVGKGRFSGNAFGVNGGGFPTNFQIPAGPFNPATIRMGCAIQAVNWAISGLLIGFGDSGSGLLGGHQNLYMGVGLNLSGVLTIIKPPINFSNQGTVVATGTTTLLNNSYYYIEMELTIGAAGSVNVYLNGTLEATVSGIDTRGAGGLSGSVYSFYWSCPQAGGQFYFCDGYVADSLLGPLQVIDATPISDGALTQWTPSAGTSHYPLVNEEPPDGDTTYVSSATPGQIDLYGFSPFSPGGHPILGVQVSLFARKDDLAVHTIATEVRSGGSNFTGTTQPALTTTYVDYVEVYNADPNTGLAWTAAGLNAAQFGENLIS